MSFADFLNAPLPEPTVLPEAQTSGARRFFNRELSWLAFNWRVLEEAENPRVPLLERVRFVSISAGNLDEFYTVRVAGLRELAQEGNTGTSDDGRTPAEQLKLINADARRLMQHQQAAWVALSKELEREGITVVTRSALKAADKKHLEEEFLARVFPVLSPLAIDPAHPFPFIPNEGLRWRCRCGARGRAGVAGAAADPEPDRPLRAPARAPMARPVPAAGGASAAERRRAVPGLRAGRVLHLPHPARQRPGGGGRGRGPGARIRDRAQAPPPGRGRAPADQRGAPEDLKARSSNSSMSQGDEIVDVKGMIGLVSLKELVLDDRPDLLWKSFTPRVPERVQDHDGDMFAAIRQKDMLLHHPYETFDMVVRFLSQAARDPNVVAIKQTLYRTSNESPIVDALCEAAENGKSVTALVELKARFDEAANIRQSRKLERSGAHVIYGFLNYKTHAKISTVVRREGDRLVTYTHFGTGNYHPITARIYTDLSLFTCDDALGRDATKVFNYVGGYAEPEGLENLAISPLSAEGADHRGAEGRGRARARGQARHGLGQDEQPDRADVIDALYEASQAGVKIDLVIRGICGLRPGIVGLSETIRVKSIVGRFLEHSRIVCFGNGHGLPHKKARVYISSADWMGRNLNRRVETLVECTNATVKAQIVSQIMAANLADVAQSWVLQPDGSFRRADLETMENPFSCHRFFMENPSLSGRGSAGAKDVPDLTHSNE
jgi:polyphosphate kinase